MLSGYGTQSNFVSEALCMNSIVLSWLRFYLLIESVRPPARVDVFTICSICSVLHAVDPEQEVGPLLSI